MLLSHPSVLLLLWLLPAVALLRMHAHRRTRAASQRFAQPVMLQRLMPQSPILRSGTRGAALVGGVGLLIFACSGPRIGTYFENVTARGVDLLVVLDVSKSMLAEDVAPNRLERSKSDIRDLLEKLHGHRVGLIAFAGAPVVKVPLTTDQGFFLQTLESVDTDSAPRGGSLIGDAIRKGLESMPEQNDRDRVMVIITDGEDHDSFPDEAAELAMQQKVKIFTVGMGDDVEGNRIPLRGEDGRIRFLKHDGQEVWSKMDERLLKRIALKTGGAYVPAKTSAYDLGAVYEDHLAGLTMGEIHTQKRKRYRPRFQWFAAFGLGLVLLESLISRYPRQTMLSPDTVNQPGGSHSGPKPEGDATHG